MNNKVQLPLIPETKVIRNKVYGKTVTVSDKGTADDVANILREKDGKSVRIIKNNTGLYDLWVKLNYNVKATTFIADMVKEVGIKGTVKIITEVGKNTRQNDIEE